jgi:hypothetical protein
MPKHEDENPLADVECYDLAEELADRMQLPSKQRASFIHQCMTRSGYAPTQTRESYVRRVRDDEREDARAGQHQSSRRRTAADNDSF